MFFNRLQKPALCTVACKLLVLGGMLLPSPKNLKMTSFSKLTFWTKNCFFLSLVIETKCLRTILLKIAKSNKKTYVYLSSCFI